MVARPGSTSSVRSSAGLLTLLLCAAGVRRDHCRKLSVGMDTFKATLPRVWQGASAPGMSNPFRHFNSSPEVIRLVVMMYVKYPLSLRKVEDLLA